MGPHELEEIGLDCFLSFLQVQFSLLDRAILRLQHFELADVVDDSPGDAQLLRERQWKFVDHIQVSFSPLIRKLEGSGLVCFVINCLSCKFRKVN
uniref:Uncharacterized protein n=1 Tax=Lepeophtheirus salmonis TaxID=72036 RepID=A0A0K2TTY3_LEPSM